jgi:uncharacterized protein YdeI (YjbR/CyaY-like superfamily)
MTKDIEIYFEEGCGRCPLGGTPDCKVHQWATELDALRNIILDCGLTEQSKWGVPCYSFQRKNILILSAFKEYCSISFFKGSLLADDKNLLVKPGKNSQAARLFKFTSIDQIQAIEEDIKAYIFEAIEVEKAGLKVIYNKNPEPIPEELEQKFEADLVFKNAFEALTPGRQRGYIIYFSAPKQSKTRVSRIEKCIGKILNGEGLNDKYTKRSKK